MRKGGPARRASTRFILTDGSGLGSGAACLERLVGLSGVATPSIFLWTFHGLAAARHLYEKYGFRLVEERVGSQWGTQVMEQRFVLTLG